METLHSYWRMEYLKAPRHADGTKKNPFVELPKKGDDKAALIVYRSQYAYLLLNRYPYNPGHLLVIPYREVSGLEALSEAEYNDLMATLLKGKNMLQEAFAPDGFNIGFNLGSAAGAGIPQHLHGHIVPRWGGDTNFLPIVGKTRILTQALEDTWEKLIPYAEESLP